LEEEKTCLTENHIKGDDPTTITQILRVSKRNYSRNITPDSRSNDNFSQTTKAGRIQIVSRRIEGRSTSQLNPRDKAQIMGKHFQRENNILSAPEKKKTERKKEYHIPGRKYKPTKQIFMKSDRISYKFNKTQPFKVNKRKSISQAISDVQIKPERRLIKANNYYLHNYAMDNQGKNSLVSFRLNEILKEKNSLKKKLKEKYSLKPNSKHFTMKNAISPRRRRHSSNPIFLTKKIAKPPATKMRAKVFSSEKKSEINSIPQHLSKDGQIEDTDSTGEYLKNDDILLKHIFKGREGNPLIFENSLNQIRYMNSKMAAAQKEVEISSLKRSKLI